MSAANKPADFKERQKLEKQAEKKAQKLAQQQRKAQKSAQGCIEYDFMFEDGICQISPGYYSKSIWFPDINYQAAQEEEQWRVFRKYCELLNVCDENVAMQLSVVNRQAEVGKDIFLAEREDGLNDLRHDYNRILAAKVKEGAQNIARERYITFTVRAETHDKAIRELSRYEAVIRDQLRQIGCKNSEVLTGAERLKLISDIFDPRHEFKFEYESLEKRGQSTKDAVAPNGFEFMNERFMCGERFAQALYIKEMPPSLQDRFISELADLPVNMAISLHILAMDKGESIKKVNRKLAMMDKERVDGQRESAKLNLYSDSMSPELVDWINDSTELLHDIRNKGQKMFKVTCTIMVTADTLEQLENDAYQVMSVANRYATIVQPLRLMQKQGMNTCLPLGVNRVPIQMQRTHVTSSAGVMMPFTTQELVQSSPKAMYYGQNQLSNMFILLDRTTLTSPNGWIIGKPGSGKSFMAKLCISNGFLANPDDEFVIIDPDDEYTCLVERLGGEVINIGADSGTHVNPFDLIDGYGDDVNPIAFKSEFIQSLCDVIANKSFRLDAVTLSVIDRVIGYIYADCDIRNLTQSTTPTFLDFYEILLQQPEPEARYFATAIERYITGSIAVFTHHSNVNTTARIVSYNTKQLGDQLKEVGMLIVLDQVWNRLLYNHRRGVRTWIYIDESQTFFENPLAMRFFDNIYSRARKYFGFPTAITQNITRILSHEKGEKMLMNSDFVLMLNQSPNDAAALASLFKLSEQQQSYFTFVKEGHGLLLAGSAVVPFKNEFPKGLLYDLITTKPEDVAERNRRKYEENRRKKLAKLAESLPEVIESVDHSACTGALRPIEKTSAASKIGALMASLDGATDEEMLAKLLEISSLRKAQGGRVA